MNEQLTLEHEKISQSIKQERDGHAEALKELIGILTPPFLPVSISIHRLTILQP